MSFTLRDLDNPLIKQGMTAQLETRKTRISAGETPLGWKVGMGAPASLQKLGLNAPLVGYLMRKALLASGASVSLARYKRPVAEPEICVRMGADLGAAATAQAALAAVKEIVPAIEIADMDPVPAPDNLDLVLARDIFQRHVVLADQARPGAGMTGLTSRVMRRGAEAARTGDLEALTGKLGDIVAHVANVLAACGEKLQAGDIIITGSITPPLMLEADETQLTHAVDPIGAASVHFTR